MSTTIVFVPYNNFGVLGAFEDESFANHIAKKNNGKVDAWVLESKSLEESTVDEWLTGRKVIQDHNISHLKPGVTVYFSDDICRGIGVIEYIKPDSDQMMRISVKDGDLYDKISRSVLAGDTPVYMYPNDIVGYLEESK